MQPLSYSTLSRGNTSEVLSWRGHIYQGQGSSGFPLVDRGMFRSKHLTVGITAPVDLTKWTQEWSLTLVVLEEIFYD